MYPIYPVAPKQPRRVRSGERAPIREETTRGAHRVRGGERNGRVRSGQRRPIVPTSESSELRPGAHRRTLPEYALRRAERARQAEESESAERRGAENAERRGAESAQRRGAENAERRGAES
jgi:hypothetical protein